MGSQKDWDPRRTGIPGQNRLGYWDWNPSQTGNLTGNPIPGIAGIPYFYPGGIPVGSHPGFHWDSTGIPACFFSWVRMRISLFLPMFSII